MVNKPEPQWFLYINKNHPQAKFNHTHVKSLKETETELKAKVIGLFGKNSHRELIDEIITIDKTIPGMVKVSYISREHIDYLKSRIRKIEPNPYLENLDEIWLLYTVAGYDTTLNGIIRHRGILNAQVIEEIIASSTLEYKIIRGNKLYERKEQVYSKYFMETHNLTSEDSQDIEALEVLKKYGLRVMEEVNEKITCFVG